jgi:hypothetical protein
MNLQMPTRPLLATAFSEAMTFAVKEVMTFVITEANADLMHMIQYGYPRVDPRVWREDYDEALSYA